jgi:hypothetical protein
MEIGRMKAALAVTLRRTDQRKGMGEKTFTTDV